MPDLALVVLLCGLLYPVMSGVARTRPGFGGWLAAMAGVQLVFHLALSPSARMRPTAADPHPWRMLLFHAGAAVVCAALLASCDRRAVRDRVLVAPAAAVPARPAGRRRAALGRRGRARRQLTTMFGSDWHRGVVRRYWFDLSY